LLRGMTADDQRRVIEAGSMSSCRDPVAVLRSRIRQSRESAGVGHNHSLGGVGAGLVPPGVGATLVNPGTGGAPPLHRAGGIEGGEGDGSGGGSSSSTSRCPRPATNSEVEQFLHANREWLTEDATSILRSMNRVDAMRVIGAGTMSNCRDPVAVIRSRMRREAGGSAKQGLEGGAGSPAVGGVGGTASTTSLTGVRPATPEEVEAFVVANRHFLNDDAEEILRAMNPVDKRRVLAAGTMSGCRDPIAVIRSRVRQAREQELEDGPALTSGGCLRLAAPVATCDELEAFVAGNRRWMTQEAEDLLRSFGASDQKRVIAAGTMSGCRDPVAVVQTRVKKAREMEQEFERVTRPAPETEVPMPQPDVVVPSFTPQAAIGYMFTQAEVVPTSESRFAKPVAPANKLLETIRREAEERERPNGILAGESIGIGGVVEILAMRKYGCTKGARLRCIGETSTLLQFEGGKTAPKMHEGVGWRWVLLSEEKLKKETEDEKSRLAAAELKDLLAQAATMLVPSTLDTLPASVVSAAEAHPDAVLAAAHDSVVPMVNPEAEPPGVLLPVQRESGASSRSPSADRESTNKCAERSHSSAKASRRKAVSRSTSGSGSSRKQSAAPKKRRSPSKSSSSRPEPKKNANSKGPKEARCSTKTKRTSRSRSGKKTTNKSRTSRSRSSRRRKSRSRSAKRGKSRGRSAKREKSRSRSAKREKSRSRSAKRRKSRSRSAKRGKSRARSAKREKSRSRSAKRAKSNSRSAKRGRVSHSRGTSRSLEAKVKPAKKPLSPSRKRGRSKSKSKAEKASKKARSKSRSRSARSASKQCKKKNGKNKASDRES